MVAQAPSLPLFMGRLSFCVENAVAAVGGQAVLEPGDVLLYNHPFGTGSHPQDAAVVMPIFHATTSSSATPRSRRTGSTSAARSRTPRTPWTCSRRGRSSRREAGQPRPDRRDIYRMALANSRVPKAVAGDINAELVGVRAGAEGFLRLIGATGSTSSGRASSGCSTTARRSSAASSSASPTAATSAAGRSTRTASTTACRVRRGGRSRRPSGGDRLQRRPTSAPGP